MDRSRVQIDKLAKLLREAEKRHGEYEEELGKKDEDWPDWYARYITERLWGEEIEG